MIRKIANIGNGLHRWRIELRMPKGYPKPRVCTHFEASEAEAHRMHADLLAVKARGKMGLPFAQPSALAPTLGAACARYEQHLMTMNRTSDYIVDVATEFVLLKATLGEDMPITGVTRAHVLQWMDARGKQLWRGKTPKPRTINKALAMVSAFFQFCETTIGWIERNPASVPKVKEIAPALKTLRWRDYLAFSKSAWEVDPLFGLFLEVLCESGARVQEVIDAKVGDIDIKAGVWRKLVKPGRFVEPLAMEWTIWAAKGREASEPLCPSRVGGAWCYETIRNAFQRHREAIGHTTLMPHHLRHARACWLLAEGQNPHRVKDFLCHATIKTTELYTKSAETIRREEGETVHKNLMTIYDKHVSKTFIERSVAHSLHMMDKGFNIASRKGLKRK